MFAKKNKDKTKLDLWKLPKYLNITLSRHPNKQIQRYSKKVQTNILYPICDLLLKSCCTEKVSYDLYGVVLHHGDYLKFGHYNCYVKCQTSNQWFLMNDNRYTLEQNLNKLQSKNAYILFYKRKDNSKNLSANPQNRINNLYSNDSKYDQDIDMSVINPSNRNIRCIDLVSSSDEDVHMVQCVIVNTYYLENINILFQGLTVIGDEQHDEIDNILSNDAVMEINHITIRDLNRLYSQQDMNTDIVGACMRLLQSKYKDCLFFGTEFYSALVRNGNGSIVYSNVKRRTTLSKFVKRYMSATNIFEVRNIFWPVHVRSCHWILVCADMAQKVLHPYDSIYGFSDYNTICNNIIKYIQMEYENKIENQNSMGTVGWTIQLHPEYPQQNDGKNGVGNDCGIFTMKCAEWIAEKVAINFTQDDMLNFRLRTILDIYRFESEFVDEL